MANIRHRRRLGVSRKKYLFRRAQEVLLLLIIATAVAYKPVHGRACGVHEINKDREKLGQFATLYPQQRRDKKRFKKYTRVTTWQFDYLLGHLRTKLTRKSRRQPLSPRQRLLITLRYLASGDSIYSLALAYRIGESTCREVIYSTCDAIWDILGPLYLKPPSTPADFEEIAKGFEEQWNLPHCVGAIDGKHVSIQCPKNSGSEFFNYKKHFSLVLMAACDSKYRFTHVDVGCQGSISDSGVFRHSPWGADIISGDMPLPPACPLPRDPTATPVPYYFVGDEAFPLLTNLMRPYPRRNLTSLVNKVFNYRLSRARRVIENAFGILVSKFRIFRSTICCSEDNAEKIVRACLVLHNFMLDHGAENFLVDQEGRLQDKEISSDGFLEDLPDQREGRNAGFTARGVRDFLSGYLFSPAGSVPWQVTSVTQGRHHV